MSENAIGEAAGSVWKFLAEQGPVSFRELSTGLGEDRDLVAMAIGWLAREDKLQFKQEGRDLTISLKGQESSKPAVQRVVASRR